MITLIAKDKRTGKEEEFTTDYLFGDRYGRFILEDKDNWEFKVKNIDASDDFDKRFETITSCGQTLKKCNTCGDVSDILDF